MKIIIDISKEEYTKILGRDIVGYSNKYESMIANGTRISDNATNGDIIKGMFPNLCLQYNDICIEGDGDYCVAQDIINNLYFEYNWWNAPYKEEK